MNKLLPGNAVCNPELGAAFDALARQVAIYVVQELRAGDCGMHDQTASPLGRRRHCAATRRRTAAGDPGAAVVGRRHLLSDAALAEELQSITTKAKPRKPAAPKPPSVRAELEAELGALRLVGGGS